MRQFAGLVHFLNQRIGDFVQRMGYRNNRQIMCADCMDVVESGNQYIRADPASVFRQTTESAHCEIV